jgi:hypothetical protein
MNKRLLCFFGIHDYEIKKRGEVEHRDMIVGFWTLRECNCCGKSKYKQYY